MVVSWPEFLVHRTLYIVNRPGLEMIARIQLESL